MLFPPSRIEETWSLVSELLIMSGHSRDSGTYICRSSTDLIASVDVNVLVGELMGGGHLSIT